MTLKLKEKYCDEESLATIINGLADAIFKDYPKAAGLALIGILKGGAPVADMIAARIEHKYGLVVPVAYVDITLYRDDVIDTPQDPYSRMTEIPFAVRKKIIVLVDDVLCTGRTIRAALTQILALGRPRLIRLAVGVDRGHRELPIHADYVGRAIEVSRREGVRVRVAPDEAEKGAFLYEETPA